MFAFIAYSDMTQQYHGYMLLAQYLLVYQRNHESMHFVL